MPRIAKRPAAAAAASPAPEKKAKKVGCAGYDEGFAAGVVGVVKQADLPKSCQDMLLTALPSACTPPEGRHEYQGMIISWIEEVMSGVQSKMKDSLAAAEEVEAAAEETKSTLDAEVTAAQATLTEKQEVTASKTEEEATCSAAVQAARQALRAAKKAKSTGDSAIAEVQVEKDQLDTLIAEHFMPLKQAEGFEAEKVPGHLKALQPLIKTLTLDDSLAAALPSACARHPDSRSEIDNLALRGLDECIQAKVSGLASQIAEHEPAAAERAAEVEQAASKLHAAEEAASAAASALATAKGEQAEAEATLSQAELSVKKFVDGRSAQTKDRDDKAFALENFTGYNMLCFEMLTKKPTEAEQPSS